VAHYRYAALGIATVFVISGPALPAELPDTSEAAMTAIRTLTRDPDSVRFQGLTIGKFGSICGQYNATNGFGGYAGFLPFAYFQEQVIALGLPPWESPKSKETFQIVWSTYCGK